MFASILRRFFELFQVPKLEEAIDLILGISGFAGLKGFHKVAQTEPVTLIIKKGVRMTELLSKKFDDFDIQQHCVLPWTNRQGITTDSIDLLGWPPGQTHPTNYRAFEERL